MATYTYYGDDESLAVRDEVDSEGNLLVIMQGDYAEDLDVRLNDEDAERLIMHLKHVFNIKDTE